MRIMLAAGGSGGHIFPSVALASELEKLGEKDIYFVSSKRRLDKNILSGVKHPAFFLSANPMPLNANPLRMIVFAVKFLIDAFISLGLVLRVRPSVVVGFGGYSSGAITVAAKVLGVPVLIHEQNLLPGRANRLLSRIADRVAVSFEETEKHIPHVAGKIIYSGNPLRLDMLSNDRVKSAQRLGLSPDKPTVLVMGGSQGSSFLNRTASEAARYIKEEKGSSVQFIHLTGRLNYDKVKSFYEENNIPGKVFAFLDRIDDVYAISDVAISRAGAAATFELAFYAKAMILVPYPNPKNNQRFNAMYFSRAGAAVYREEKSLTRDDLASEVLSILNDSEKRNSLSSAASKLSVPLAGKILAREVIKLGNKKK